jgi:hypothetical protein
MNDVVADPLQAYLDRLVAAAPTSRARQQEMREELQAHLVALYEKELLRLQDERAAAQSAIQQFGASEDLSNELQASVPFWERFIFLVQEKGAIMWRWLLLLGCVAIPVGLGFVFPAIAKFNNPDLAVRSESVGLSIALLVLGITVTLGGLGSCIWGAMLKLRPKSS